MGVALKLCPFCGGEASWDGFSVWCKTCGASTDAAAGYDRDDAISAWNRRASDPALAKAREALEAADNLIARGDDATRQERGLVGLTVINALAALKGVE